MRTLAMGLLVMTGAWAQTQDGGTGPAPSEPDGGPAQAAGAPSSEAAPAADAPTYCTQDQMEAAKARLVSLEEQLSETKSSLSSMSKLKLSGYVQGRFQYADDSQPATVKDGFSVRRGRLKGTYKTDWAQLVLQVDATPRGVTLKDAEATLFEPWTPLKLFLTVGQMKWPFGYEVVQSSSDRELPERTRMVRAFAPGERDRGFKLGFKAKPFDVSVGVFDGNGTDDRAFVGVDNGREKDVVGRACVDFGTFSGGVSGWWGKTYNPSELIHHPRNRIGADAQLELDLLGLGRTALKGEFIAGTTYSSGGREVFGQTALGWYLLLVQNVGQNHQIGARVDFFDPATGTPDGVDPASPEKPLPTNGITTLGLVGVHHVNGNLKLTAAYEIPMTATAGSATDPADNLFTLQLQARF